MSKPVLPEVPGVPEGGVRYMTPEQVQERFSAQKTQYLAVGEWLAALQPGQTALYCGASGRHRAVGFLAQAVQRDDLTIVDLSGEPPSQRETQTDPQGAAGRVVAPDGEGRIPIADRSQDCVVSWSALTHVPNPADHVSELARCIKPGGRLVLANGVGSAETKGLWSLLFAVPRYGGRWAMEELPTFGEIGRWIRRAGLVLDEVFPILHVDTLVDFLGKGEQSDLGTVVADLLSRLNDAFLAEHYIHRDASGNLLVARPAVVLRAIKPGEDQATPRELNPSAVTGGRTAPFAPILLDLIDRGRLPIGDILAIGSDDTVLDVGCGDGMMAVALADRCRRFVGIDPEPTAKRQAERNLAEHRKQSPGGPGADAEFRTGAGEDLRQVAAGERFSIVTCWGSMHHFRDPHVVMREISEIVMPDSTLIVLDAALPAEARDLWTFASTAVDLTTSEHLTYTDYLALVREAGFTPIAVFPVGSDARTAELTQDLDGWLSRAEAIRSNSGGDDPLVGVAVRNLRELMLNSPPGVRQQMRLREDPVNPGRWLFSYDPFILIARRTSNGGATSDGGSRSSGT